MYLSVATTHRPATDLGFLLHKHPGRVHETDLAFGKSLVVFPQADEDRCEAALVIDIDPIGLVRGRGRGEGLLDQYVNDRPYAATSLLSMAMARALRTAMSGQSRERPELASAAIPLEARVTPLPARHGGERLVRELFEPLGWSVEVQPVEGPGSEAGAGANYLDLRLSGIARLSELLNHLYVLIPVLDDDKHYWVGEDEVQKLLSRGQGWLEAHPARELIVRRYLVHRRTLANSALERLAPEAAEPEAEARKDDAEARLETPIFLNDQRMEAVIAALKTLGARTVADLGCGEGKLLARLNRERWISRLVGVDASAVALDRAEKRLKLNLAGGASAERVQLLHGALTYRDKRWAGMDAAVLVEVVEHLDTDRLPALAEVVFGQGRPKAVIVTTPNADYNALFPNLAAGAMRHPDHRFEWTRAEFRAWVTSVEEAYGYVAQLQDVGAVDQAHGAPTQMAVFTR